jgi:hypothetical protein
MIDFVQVAMEAMYEWFDEYAARYALRDDREEFSSRLLRICQEIRLQERDKRTIAVPMYPITPSAGQIEKSEMYMKMVKRMVYWKNRYELAVRGMPDKAVIAIIGEEP